MRNILIGAAFAIMLAGPTQAQTEVEFWHAFSGGAGDALGELVQQFNDSQDEVTVNPIYTGNYDEGTTKLQAALQGGTAPTLVMLEITRYGLFAERGALEPLQRYLDSSDTHLLDRIRPFALEASKYKGESYVLPFNVSTPIMYYNRDAFRAAGLDPENPPKTWKELVAAGETLTRTGGDGQALWGINPPPQWVRWAMTNQAGGGWIDPTDNSVQIDMADSVRAYQEAADWINVEKISPIDAAFDENTAKQYFQTGTVAITFDSTGSLGSLTSSVEFDLGVAPLPCDTVCAAPIGGATLGILASAPQEKKAAAWKFLEFVTSEEPNALIFVRTGYLPIIIGAIDTQQAQDAIKENPAYLVADKQLDVAFGRARPPAMPEIRSLEPAVWEEIVLQQKTAEEALGEFAEKMRTMIENN